MIISKEEHSYIKNAFQKLESKEDLLELLNYVKKIYFKKKYVPFEIKQLTYYSNPSISKRYRIFEINKKSGGTRTILAPSKGLRIIQRCLNIIFQCVYTPHKSATGFILGKSILHNAQRHTGSNYIFNLDLKNFFPSIDQARVWKRFQLPPFNLGNTKNRLRLANMLAALCCTKAEVERENENKEWVSIFKNILPQGAPTSPIISNAICEKLDIKLTGLANRFGLRYSRYVDDITFSSMHFVYHQQGDFLKELYRIISDQRFCVNPKKVRLQTTGHRQDVTGLIISDKVNVRREFIKEIRKWLYYWENYGKARTEAFFYEMYESEKGHVKSLSNDIERIILGKLNYLRMIRGANDNLYQNLKSRMDKLLNKKSEKIEKNGNDKISNPQVHEPRALVKLLYKFSENNSALKYATHSWESGIVDGTFQNYEKFIERLKEEFAEISYKLSILNKNLAGKIYAFLLRENEGGKYFKDDKWIEYSWGTNNLDIGWSSRELANWCKENPNKDPYDFPLPSKRVVGKIQLVKFSQVVDIFKREIEIRAEGNQLEELFIHLRKEHLGIDFETPNYINLKQKSFYTDVDALVKSLSKIFRELGKRTQYPKITISAVDNTSSAYIELYIIQHQSNNLHMLSSEMLNAINSGDFGDIAKWLNNICDWAIESQFKDGNFRITFLAEEQISPTKTPSNNTDGFTHILKFYKS